GESGPTRGLLGGSDVIPEIDSDDRQPRVAMEDDLQAVGELVFLEVELHLGGLITPLEATREQQDRQHRHEHQLEASTATPMMGGQHRTLLQRKSKPGSIART